MVRFSLIKLFVAYIFRFFILFNYFILVQIIVAWSWDELFLLYFSILCKFSLNSSIIYYNEIKIRVNIINIYTDWCFFYCKRQLICKNVWQCQYILAMDYNFYQQSFRFFIEFKTFCLYKFSVHLCSFIILNIIKFYKLLVFNTI